MYKELINDPEGNEALISEGFSLPQKQLFRQGCKSQQPEK
jgi:hypothetical protein